MASQQTSVFTFLAVVQIFIALIVSSAGDIHVWVLEPGALPSPSWFHILGIENFDNITSRYYTNYSSNFGLGLYPEIHGDYSCVKVEYSGSYGGRGNNAVVYSDLPQTLLVTRKGRNDRKGRLGVGFFGFYWASIEDTNEVEFFRDGVSLLNFTGAQAIEEISKTVHPRDYYGNRYRFDNFNKHYNPGQAYAYFEFHFHNVLYDQVVFRDTHARGSVTGIGHAFETDDHAIGCFQEEANNI